MEHTCLTENMSWDIMYKCFPCWVMHVLKSNLMGHTCLTENMSWDIMYKCFPCWVMHVMNEK